MQEAPLLLTVERAAERLEISRSRLFELMATGELESIKLGRLRRIPADALTAYVDRLRAETQADPATAAATGHADLLGPVQLRGGQPLERTNARGPSRPGLEPPKDHQRHLAHR